MHSVGKARNGIGESRGGVHSNAGLSSHTTPCVRHVDSGLFVPGVDEPKVLVGHHVEYGQDVVAGEREYRTDSLQIKGPRNEVTATDHPRSGHVHLRYSSGLWTGLFYRRRPSLPMHSLTFTRNRGLLQFYCRLI